MLLSFLKIKNYIPNECYQTVFDIDYNKLYEQGKRILLIDLDNTLISYSQTSITKEIEELFLKLKRQGFEIALISNNTKSRLVESIRDFEIIYQYSARKPFKKGFRKILKKFPDFLKDNVIVIGDQLMTDVLGAKRYGIDVILVKSIERKSEKWYTKLNRQFEKIILKKMKRKFPHKYQSIIEINEDK